MLNARSSLTLYFNYLLSLALSVVTAYCPPGAYFFKEEIVLSSCCILPVKESCFHFTGT